MWVQSWAGKIPWRRAWQFTPVFLPGESLGQGSLVGFSPWGCKESHTTKGSSLCVPPYIFFIHAYICGLLSCFQILSRHANFFKILILILLDKYLKVRMLNPMVILFNFFFKESLCFFYIEAAKKFFCKFFPSSVYKDL